MKQNSHRLKLSNIWTGLLLDRQKLRSQLPFLLGIVGEENVFLNSLDPKLRLKTCSFKDQQEAEKHKLLVDWPNQQKHRFFELKLRNTHKQVMWEKTQAQSFKIRTSYKLNLAKVGVNNYKAKYEKFMQHLQTRVREQVYLQILDAMIGEQISDAQIINKKLQDLKKGHYNSQMITLIPNTYKPKILTELTDPFPPQRSMTRQVKEIFHILFTIYHDRMKEIYEKVDIQKEAIRNVEEEGIIFIDEIDKLAVPQGPIQMGKGVSTEGVQRDLLPIIEGTVINTKYGDVKTDHILFIASGSFSMSKIDDLIPELLGRLPIRVRLNPITEEQLYRILVQPQYNLLFQHRKLMQAQNIQLSFTDEAIKQIARCAYEMNLHNQNLGARRLHSIVEKVLEEISFHASDLAKNSESKIKIDIDDDLIRERLKGFWEKTDVRKQLI